MGWLPAAITGFSHLLGGFIGDQGQRSANRTNLQIARESREHDVNMWQRQNEYNTPEMQMQRLREAGLNPNLMYGQGNTGNAASPQKAPVPEVQNELQHLAQTSLAPALSIYQDWKVKQAQVNNIQADTEAKRQNAALLALRGVSQDFMNKRLDAESPFWKDTAMYRAHQEHSNYYIKQFQAKTAKDRYNLQLPNEIQNSILRNDLLNEQIKGNRLENELNEQLKPFGASSRDPLLHRIITLFLGNNKHSRPILNSLFK